MTLIRSEERHLGIRVDRDQNLEESICTVANALARRLGLTTAFLRVDLSPNPDHVGEDYGIPLEEGAQALKELWQREGVPLGLVHTPKAMAALIDLARKGEWADEHVAFLHSDGAPSVSSLPPPIQLSFPSPIS